jgi:hypothetical protein
MSVRLFNDVLIGGTLRLNELSGGSHPLPPVSGGQLLYALSGRLYTEDVSGGIWPVGLTSGVVLHLYLASGAVRWNNLASGAVLSGNIGSGQIGDGHIASGNVHWHNLGSGAVLSGAIASGQVGQRHLGSGVVAGSWPQYPGKCLGSSFVATEQSTTSASFVDLTTTQHLAFTLDVACDVVVMASTDTFNSTASAVNRIGIDVDGSDTGYDYEMPASGANKIVQMSAQYKVALSAGAHTIKLQFATNAGTASYRQRGISVWRAN